MINEGELKDYTKTAMLGILSNSNIIDSMIINRAEEIKNGKSDIGTHAEDIANLAYIFGMALYDRLHSEKL
jgi:hypothetical protein